MANDPIRDLLPVKDIDERSNRSGYSRADRSLVAKLKRCDLEDKYIKLYDENTHVKKQLNFQEEKIKRLGAKLIRLMTEKKNCPDNISRSSDIKGLEELKMRIIELQHENYTLKDKNVVLKQQLASHARHHVAAHGSPSRSLHTSPRISNRQISAQNVNDNNYIMSGRNQPRDVQLREAEEHIHALNVEIQGLHNKIGLLQQDLEKCSLESQKSKVSENIEMIRLQRTIKQQSIQIASLQAHIKNSEKGQKLLRDELAEAHKENEESLQMISDKQREILDLYTKLDEHKVIRLEQEEMKERINDLTSERDCLKERGEFLMKTIEVKSSESEMINDLKKLLANEKAKKEELKESLENAQKLLQTLKDTPKISLSESSVAEEAVPPPSANTPECKSRIFKMLMTTGTQTTPESPKSFFKIKRHESELELLTSTQIIATPDGRKRKYATGENNETKKENGKCRDTKTVAVATMDLPFNEYSKNFRKEMTTQTERSEVEWGGDLTEEMKIFEAEKLNLKRELDYVKQMLRSQTERCFNQDEEINQLKNDLRVSEEKYNDTLRRLDLHLKIFRHLDSRAGRCAEDENIDTDELGKKKGLENDGNDPAASLTKDSQTVNSGKMKTFHGKCFGSSDGDNKDEDKINEVAWDREFKGKTMRKDFTKKSRENEKFSSDSSDSVHPIEIIKKQNDGSRPVPKPRRDVPKCTGDEGATLEMGERKSQNNKLAAGAAAQTPEKNITICIEWLQLEPNTPLWHNDNIKLLFVDFRFLDVKGEETETPSSSKKPAKPGEKCSYNFTKSIVMNEERLHGLSSVREKSGEELICFKVVSEPDESNDEDECVDVGMCEVSVKEFFESDPKTSLLLPVKNIFNSNEKIGTLSIKLNISAISEYFRLI